MHIDYKTQKFEKKSAVFSKSDTNEEKTLREHAELKEDVEIDKEIKGIYHKTFTHSIMEESEEGSRNQDQKQKIPKDEKQMTEYKIIRRRSSRKKGKETLEWFTFKFLWS